jgi:hypothetical protein
MKELVRKEKLEFLAIQETKLENVTDSLCHSLWGGEDCQWAFHPSSGNSGGLLSIWSKVVAQFRFSFVGEGFVGVCLEWGAHKNVCYVVNVYSSCDIHGKRRLWEGLLAGKQQFGRGVWGVMGDFNAVLNQEERKGMNLLNHSATRLERLEFGEFVRNMELVDLPVLGRNFTWFHPNGITMSRIDRLMVSEDWLVLWRNLSLWVLPRTVSDHCAILMRLNNVDWGPKPFWFNNYWLLHKDFRGLVENCWRNCNFTGWMAFILREKLKAVKNCIRSWHKITYGAVDAKITKLVDDIKELDVKSEQVALSEGEVLHRKNMFLEMWHLRTTKESTLSQRSRQNWLKEGDSNTRYFHACINSRGKRNFISALRVGEDWLETPVSITQAVVEYFKEKFNTVVWSRPRIDGVVFPSLLDSENQWLTRPFAMMEIENVVKDCDGNKSPGPMVSILPSLKRCGIFSKVKFE